MTSPWPADVSSTLGYENSTEDAEAFLRQKDDEYAVNVLPAIIYVAVLLALGVPGNVLVLYVYRRKSTSTSTFRSFVQALAVYDLVSCVILMPGEIVDMRRNYTFGTSPFCQVYRAVGIFCGVASVLTLVMVAIERYCGICRPLGRGITPRVAKVLIAICITVAAVSAAPALAMYGPHTTLTENPAVQGADCSVADSVRDTAFPLVYGGLAGLLFLWAIVTMGVLYALMGRKLWRRDRFRRRGFRLTLLLSRRRRRGRGDSAAGASPPASRGGETPSGADGKTSTEAQRKTPTEEQGKTPTEAEGKTSTEAQRKTPTEAEGKTSTKAQGKTPTEAQEETSTEKQGRTPTETQEKTPTEAQGKTPTEAKERTPTEAQGKTSTEEQGKTPTEKQGKTPTEAQERAPTEEQGKTPTEAKEKTSTEAKDDKPREEEETKPAAMSDAKEDDAPTDRRPADSQGGGGNNSKEEGSGPEKPARVPQTQKPSVSPETRRQTRMLFMVTAVFVLSFLPFLCATAIKLPREGSPVSRGGRYLALGNILMRSYFINSVANPFIYSFCSRAFRRECSGILCCCRRRR